MPLRVYAGISGTLDYIFTFGFTRSGGYFFRRLSALLPVGIVSEPSPIRSLAADYPILTLFKPWLCLSTRSGSEALRVFRQLKEFTVYVTVQSPYLLRVPNKT